MSKRITDKMRLDFITREGLWIGVIPSGEYVIEPDINPGCGFSTPRQAIDAAMREKKKFRSRHENCHR